MQIILQEDVEKLGTRGQVVDVANGYARNFLLPRNLGIEATPGNLKRLEKMRATFAKKEATEKEAAQKLAELLSAVSLSLTRKAGENDQLFGSVTTGDIADALGASGLPDRKAEDRSRRSNQSDRRISDSDQTASRHHEYGEAYRFKRRIAGIHFARRWDKSQVAASGLANAVSQTLWPTPGTSVYFGEPPASRNAATHLRARSTGTTGSASP